MGRAAVALFGSRRVRAGGSGDGRDRLVTRVRPAPVRPSDTEFLFPLFSAPQSASASPSFPIKSDDDALLSSLYLSHPPTLFLTAAAMNPGRPRPRPAPTPQSHYLHVVWVGCGRNIRGIEMVQGRGRGRPGKEKCRHSTREKFTWEVRNPLPCQCPHLDGHVDNERSDGNTGANRQQRCVSPSSVHRIAFHSKGPIVPARDGHNDRNDVHVTVRRLHRRDTHGGVAWTSERPDDRQICPRDTAPFRERQEMSVTVEDGR
jgi:hypothetical protein